MDISISQKIPLEVWLLVLEHFSASHSSEGIDTPSSLLTTSSPFPLRSDLPKYTQRLSLVSKSWSQLIASSGSLWRHLDLSFSWSGFRCQHSGLPLQLSFAFYPWNFISLLNLDCCIFRFFRFCGPLFTMFLSPSFCVFQFIYMSTRCT